MKQIIISAALILSAITAFAQPKLSKDNIDEVIKAMTLEEKATLSVGGGRAVNAAGVSTGITSLVEGAAGCTREIKRLGIPSTVLADGPAGLRISPTRDDTNSTFYCTAFPIGTLLASTWDPQTVSEVTAAIGNETLEYGVDVLLAPGLNIHRNPLCGRNFEYFSEDPYLTGKMAAAYANGVQSNGVGVSIKHFAVNNQETNRKENDAVVSERALREIYLKGFEIAVKESAPWTVMSSYNKLNGEYTQQSYDLLTKILRDDWGFNGIVMTDWGNKEWTAKAVEAGNDLMEPGEKNEIDRIVNAVKDGSLDEADLDRNVRRILEYIVKTPSFLGYKHSDKPDMKAHAEIARKGAGEGIILLRNENNTLPIPSGQKVALYGETSVDFVAGGTGSGTVNKAYCVNMKEALQNAGFSLDESLVTYYDSYISYNDALLGLTGTVRTTRYGISKFDDPSISRAAVDMHAAANDVAIVVLGRISGEATDRVVDNNFNLTDIERQLLNDVSEAFHRQNKKMIVVLNIGGVIETVSWKNLADAIVLPWLPGQEGANATADVLCGKINPSGKLPMTFPVNYLDHPSSKNFPNGAQSGKDFDSTLYEEGIWVGYRFFDTVKKDVSYPFGFGLSYTDFSYTKPVVKASKDGFTASITVTNTGKVAGKEAVELYVSAPQGGLVKPEKELKAFAKTKLLQPGESQTLTMKVTAYELASFNEKVSQWETAAGTYTVKFGASVADIRATASYKQAKAQTFSVSAHACAPQEELNEIVIK